MKLLLYRLVLMSDNTASDPTPAEESTVSADVLSTVRCYDNTQTINYMIKNK